MNIGEEAAGLAQLLVEEVEDVSLLFSLLMNQYVIV